jgi:hypothetical protein
MRMIFVTAAALGLAGFGATPAAATAPQVAMACASGYHVDRGGNCQPNAGETNRYCPPGYVFHPSFDGWYCESPSGRTYY